MIKITIVTLALSLTTLVASSAHANEVQNHEGHDHSQKENTHADQGHVHHDNPFKHEVNKETIEKAARKEVQTLVAKKKIPQSWKHVPISKIGKTHYGDTDDWVVGFDNIKIKNKKRQTLYIFVSVGGEIRGANYTGN